MTTRVEAVTDAATLASGAHLFDEPLDTAASRRFLDSETHHVLFAYQDDAAADPVALGMITGVELTHPDKGTEMLVYELAVDEGARRRGIATALLAALAEVARARGCYGLWLGTEPDNVAALATYRKARPDDEESFVGFTWTFPAG